MLGLFKLYDSLGIRTRWIVFISGLILGLGVVFLGITLWTGTILGTAITIIGMLLTFLMCALAGRRSP